MQAAAVVNAERQAYAGQTEISQNETPVEAIKARLPEHQTDCGSPLFGLLSPRPATTPLRPTAPTRNCKGRSAKSSIPTTNIPPLLRLNKRRP